MQKKKIAVIFGGNSTEYEVSLHSAFSVSENINKEKIDIVPIGITRNGDWYHYTGKKEKIANNTWFEDNDKAKLEIDLRPVLSLKAKVVLIRKIKQGESVGYSRAFTATRDSLIAILPIGYADGFPRNLSCGNSYALIGGRQAPIVGKICMDQLAVDVTDIPNVKTGSIATLIGKDGKEEITAPMVAESAESITNELLSRMGHRLNIIRRA